MSPKRSGPISSLLLGLAILVIVLAIHESFWWDRGDEARSTALACSVAIVFGLGSMRRPWFFLALIAILDVLRPQVHGSTAHDLLVGGFHLGWMIGMPAGRFQSWLNQPRSVPASHRLLNISFDIPAGISQRLRQDGDELAREAREAFLVDRYRRDEITHGQLAVALGLDAYETDGVLKAHGVLLDITEEDLRAETRALRESKTG